MGMSDYSNLKAQLGRFEATARLLSNKHAADRDEHQCEPLKFKVSSQVQVG